MLRVKIDTDNDAFFGDGAAEVARILEVVAERVRGGQLDGVLSDINGNRCGQFDLRLELPQGDEECDE